MVSSVIEDVDFIDLGLWGEVRCQKGRIRRMSKCVSMDEYCCFVRLTLTSDSRFCDRSPVRDHLLRGRFDVSTDFAITTQPITMEMEQKLVRRTLGGPLLIHNGVERAEPGQSALIGRRCQTALSGTA